MRRENLIVGCYTVGDYEREANERLIPSVRALGLPSVIRSMPSRGTWVLNNSACQLYLRRIVEEFPKANLLYIDVDGYVHADPWPLLETIVCDVGAYFLRGTELLSGTLYLPARPRRVELLDRWIAKNSKQPEVWDQYNLQILLLEDPSFVVAHLPPEYCCIFDTQRKLTPDIRPVVEHFQASRRFKHKVGKYEPSTCQRIGPGV